ncbi:ImmA/IrrE family metallo-endopeptidase [Rummeliibacillus stabekisii]|uniref:ImmA/IrrE family metallo-endopeptidase n=1 Tax=Rummeliibacillus stabekisii TaxID=241244 RepID=UPI00371F218F
MGSIKDKANYLINKYNTNCPFKLAAYLGIQVVYEPLGSVEGYYNKLFRVPMIHINQHAKNPKFVCAHELGHAINHPETDTSFLKKYTLLSNERIEVEANTFAVELLLPDSHLGDYNTIYDAFKDTQIPEQFVYLKNFNQ